MPVGTFVLGLILARGFRFFAEGLLAVKYGNQGSQFLFTHKLEVAGIAHHCRYGAVSGVPSGISTTTRN